MKRLPAPVLGFALAILVAPCAYGWAGPITGAQMAFPEGTSKETVSEVLNFLKEQVTFLDGSFINEFSTEHYSGSAKKLTELLQLLHSSGIQVTLTFADLKDERISFSISHNSHQQARIGIAVNTGNKDFKLSELTVSIPPARNHVQPKPPAESRPWARGKRVRTRRLRDKQPPRMYRRSEAARRA